MVRATRAFILSFERSALGWRAAECNARITLLSMKYSELTARIAGEGSDAWETHYAARAALDRGEDVLMLSIGDPDLDTPIPVVERAISALRAGDTHYTPNAGRSHLREALADAHRERTGQVVTAANTIFLSGARNALFAASLCVAGPGDEVIAFEPLYPTYPGTIEVSGAKLKRVPGPAERGFHVDLQALEAAITARTRALFFATPNNPSGVILSAEEMRVIGDLAERHSLWVVVDEVYAGLAPSGRVPGLAARLPEQVITIGSLSKSHSMPGWRCGWLVGPREFVKSVEALTTCMLFGMPGFIQEAAVVALGLSREAEERVRSFCAARRDFLMAGLQDIPQLRCTAPDAGMFLLLDVSATGLSGHQFMTALFAAERVSVLDGGAFGQGTRNFVRVCFATDEAVLTQTCVRLRRFVNSLTSRAVL